MSNLSMLADINPGERLHIIEKMNDSYLIIADVEENLNIDWDDLDPVYEDKDIGFRIDHYYQGDWTLDNDLLFDPYESAIGEQRGYVAGGIEFFYETEEEWDQYDDVYDCMIHTFPDVTEIAVLGDLDELKDLYNGVWYVITPEGTCL